MIKSKLHIDNGQTIGRALCGQPVKGWWVLARQVSPDWLYDDKVLCSRCRRREKAYQMDFFNFEPTNQELPEPYEAFEQWCIANGFSDIIEADPPETVDLGRLALAIEAYPAGDDNSAT